MKKLLVLVMALCFALMLTACGKKFTCKVCGEKTKDAYYEMFAETDEDVMCEDCAIKYWMPLDIEKYKVPK